METIHRGLLDDVYHNYANCKVVWIKSVCREAWTDAADQFGIHSDNLLLNWNRGDPDWLPGNNGCHSKAYT